MYKLFSRVKELNYIIKLISDTDNFMNPKLDSEKIYYLFIPYFLFLLVLIFIYNPILDEELYLISSVHFAKMFSQGSWIGNGPGGTHGFLFKIPVSLWYMLFGPSVAAARIFHLILGVASAFLFYRILKKYFTNNLVVFSGLLLFVTNYQFFHAAITYNRHITGMFSIVLLLYLLVYNKSRWLISLSLLLMLDAKEHIFFQIVPGIGLWMMISILSQSGKTQLQRFKTLFINGLQMFSLPFAYIVIFFFTRIIPVNYFMYYMFGLLKVKASAGSDLLHDTIGGTETVIGSDEKVDLFFNIGIAGRFLKNDFENILPYVINTPLYYFFKLIFISPLQKYFLPRLISFVSLPKLIFTTGLLHSIKSFFEKKSYLAEDRLLFACFFWSFFLTFYKVGGADANYIGFIFPVVILFFLDFLVLFKNTVGNKIVLSVVFVVTLTGSLFQYIYPLYYILMTIITIILVSVILLLSRRTIKKSTGILLISLIFSVLMIGAVLSAQTLLKGGGIKTYLEYGYMYEYDKVFKNTGDTKIYTNVIGRDRYIVDFYRNNKLTNYFRYERYSNKYIDLSQLQYPDIKTFNKPISLKNIPEHEQVTYYKQKLKKYLVANNISYLYMIQSKIRNSDFHSKKIFFENYSSFDFLKLVKTKKLKNKSVYIFKVIN